MSDDFYVNKQWKFLYKTFSMEFDKLVLFYTVWYFN